MTERIGIVGLGNMGGRMSRAIVRTGEQVLGYDVRPENISDAGASAAASPRAVAENADIVLLSLPDSRIVERVMRSEDGVLAGASAGQVIVDLSTSDPTSTRALEAEVAAVGAHYVDAGISGGAAAADKGTLTLMVGGSETGVERSRRVLDMFSSQIHHMGPSGTGHVAKLLNNFLNATNLSTTAEVMIAGRKAGLNLDQLLEVINHSSGVNFASLNRFPHIVHGDYMEGGLSSDLMMKDVVLYTEYVAGLGIASLHASGPLASFGLATKLGYGDQISNHVVDALGDVSGGVRLAQEASS